MEKFILGREIIKHSKNYDICKTVIEDEINSSQKENEHVNNLKKLVESLGEMMRQNKDTTDKPKRQRKRKPFEDWLLYPNKVALLQKLHELLDNEESGRNVAKFLEALPKGLLSLTQNKHHPMFVKLPKESINFWSGVKKRTANS